MSSPSADGRTVVPLPLKKRRMTRRRFLLGGIGLASLAGARTGGYSYWAAKNPLLVTPLPHRLAPLDAGATPHHYRDR